MRSLVFAAILAAGAPTVTAGPAPRAPGAGSRPEAETPTVTRLPKPVEDTGRVRYDGAKAPRAAPAAEGDWVQLATPTPAKYGREFIDVGKDAGSFSQLRIDAAKGKVVVRRVKVYFTDGKVAHFDLGRTLDAKRRRAVIDLATNAPIDHVVVETARHSRGEYALYGSSGTVASR